MSEQAPAEDGAHDTLVRLEGLIAALREDVHRLRAPSALPSAPAEDAPVPPEAYAWLGALDSPVRRRPQIPRLLLEGLFLAAAATVAAAADLDAVAIAGVMIGAWVIVALIEWAASRAERRPSTLVYAPAHAPLPPAADPAWFSPPVEQTLLDAAEAENVTEVTRLPPADDVESTAEHRPTL